MLELIHVNVFRLGTIYFISSYIFIINWKLLCNVLWSVSSSNSVHHVAQQKEGSCIVVRGAGCVRTFYYHRICEINWCLDLKAQLAI